MNEKRQRFYYIDLLKFIAILFVIIHHSANYSWDFLNNPGIMSYLRYLPRTILSICVPVFFVANGFLLLNKNLDLKKHIIRTVRLTLLTVIWSAVVIYLLSVIRKTPLDFAGFIDILWYIRHGWTHYMWYMGALIGIYIFFPLIKSAFDSNRKVFYYFTIAAAVLTFGNRLINIAVTIITHYTSGSHRLPAVNWFNMFNPLRGQNGFAYVYFCVGGLLKDVIPYVEKNRKKSNIAAVSSLGVSTVMLFVLGVFMSGHSGSIWDIVWEGYDTVFTFINTIAVFVLATNYKGNNAGIKKMVVTVSSNTLGIYFIHSVFIEFFMPYVTKLTFLSNLAGNVLFALIVLVISLVTVLIIKKIPVLKNLL